MGSGTKLRQQKANRQYCVYLYRLHCEGKTVREIAALVGKDEATVSTRIKVGERFAPNGSEGAK